MKVFIVIPVFNESKTIEKVVLKVQESGFSNIILVDDGSTDGTKEMVSKMKHVTLVRHSINCGPGAAVQTGFEIAQQMNADIVVTLDADLQHDPGDIKKVILPLEKKECDIVLGTRFKRKNTIPFTRRLFNKVGNFVTFIISGLWVSDSQSGFKAFSKKALETIEIETSGFEFCSEIIWKMSEKNLSFVEIPIRVYYSRDSLRKGQSFANGIRTFFKLIIKSLMG